MSDDTNLESVMQRIGRILAYDRNLKVEVRGKAAYSVPGRVVIPRIDNYANLGHGAERMLHGLLDHEVGHAKHTDHSIMETAKKEGGGALGALVNSIEDGRVERLMAREFPGCGTNLRTKNRWFWTLPDHVAIFMKSRPFAAYCLAVTLWLRGHVTLDEIRARRPDTAKLIDDTRGLGLDEPLTSSADVLRVSRAIYATFKKPPPPPPPPSDEDEDDEESDEDDESEDNDDGEEQGDDGESEGSDESDSEEDGEPEEGDDAGDESEGEPSPTEKPEDEKPAKPGKPKPDAEEQPSSGIPEPGEEPEEKPAPEDGGDAPEGSDDDESAAEEDESADADSEEDEEGDGADDDASEESDDAEDSDDESDDASEEDADADDESADDSDGEDAEGDDAGESDDDADDTKAEGEPDAGEVDPYEGIRDTDEREWSDPEGMTTDPEKAVAALLSEEWDGTPYKNFDPEAFDLVRDFDREPPSPEYERGLPLEPMEKIEREASHATHALASAFEASFRARRERRPVMGADEGDIEIAALLEYATGSASSDTIYSQFVAEEAFDTVVSIVLDCSGSMQAGSMGGILRRVGKRRGEESRPRSALARRAAYAMSTALAQCAIVHEITGFTAISSPSHPWFVDRDAEVSAKLTGMKRAIIEARDHGGLDPGTLGRECGPSYRWERRGRDVENATMQSAAYAIFKNFETARLDGLKWAFGIDQNLDGEAVLWNAKRLAVRPEKRRVMLVLSDGMPAGASDDRRGAQYLKDTVKRVEDAGIEVYGVGIETDAPKNFYSRSWVAESVDHLVEVAMSSLVEILTEGRQECDNVRVA